jgi:hypothetical protein
VTQRSGSQRKRWPGVAAAVVLLIIIVGFVDWEVPDPRFPANPTATTSAATTARTGRAAEVVAQLEVKGRAPSTGYDRALFGPAWTDVDRNGCDTRNDMLQRDLVDVQIKEGTQGCRVESGVLLDRYSGERVPFVRGDGTVEIDHVVAISDAWQKGAQQWTPEQREAFANDPLNLIATTRTLNRQKGAGDAATWLPPNRAYRCAYVARQAVVKQRYGAWVTAAEQGAMLRVLAACPDEPLPDGLAQAAT